MQMVIGAAIFAVGCLFGAWLTLAGQQSQKSRTSHRFQDALLKNLEKSGNGREIHQNR